MVTPLPAPRGECCVVKGNHGNSILLARDSFRAGPIRNGNFCGGRVASRKGFPPEIIEIAKEQSPFQLWVQLYTCDTWSSGCPAASPDKRDEEAAG